MAEINTTRHAFGSKDGIEAAKASGAIDAFDMLHLTNGELAWLDKDGNTVMNTPRTQESISVNGVTGLGIENGATIPAGASIDEIVKMLVQKPIPATYAKPSISLVNNGGQGAGNVEAGTSITPKLKATFNKNDAGTMTNIQILQGSNIVADGEASPLTYDGEAIVIGDETISFNAKATYGDGAIKNNNLGQPSPDGQIKAGTVSSSAYSISGKRNMFYGTGVGAVPEITSDFVRGLVNKKLAPANGNAFTINVAVGQQYIVIAYPATLRDLNNVTYVEANDSGMAANFTNTTVDVADARGEDNGLMSYKVFTYAMAVPAAASMTMKVTI